MILSELGYSSSQGEINQAAAFAYAYYAAENNPYINAILLSRQTDAGEEIAQGLALGLSTQGGQHKYIYEVYKNIDQVNSNSYTEFAKSVIGITNWSETKRAARLEIFQNPNVHSGIIKFTVRCLTCSQIIEQQLDGF